MNWRPFGLTDNEAVDYDVLLPGVPAWMHLALLNWIASSFTADRSGDVLNGKRISKAEVATRTLLGAEAAKSGSQYVTRSQVLWYLHRLSEAELLRVADYILSVDAGRGNALEELLASAKSKWTVGDRDGHQGLVNRVAEGVQDAVEATVASGGDAGKLLARAWARVHGLQADDSGAYADAVRAAEIAAISVVQPNNAAATLGSVLGQMKADGDWKLPLREHKDAPSADLVLMSLRTLWFGHRDRHGSVSYTDVTHDEARAAVMLAATVVEWFTSGALVRRP